jgi:SAM-dependent methyltransferase
MTMDRVRVSYDAVARRYAEEIGSELAGKPVDRALYRLFAELVSTEDEDAPPVGDVGCGPGHITAHLAGLGLRPTGVDASPGMVEVARERYPALDFTVGTFAELPVPDGAWAGAVAPYSIIHVDPDDRPAAWTELARAVRPRGWLMVAFHIETAEQPPGSVQHASEWWGHPVDLDFHYLDPVQIAAELAAGGFQLVSRTDREPRPGVEHQSRRCYLIARRA